MRNIDKMCRMFLIFGAIISVKVWERSCNYFLHLPIPPNIKLTQGSLWFCIEWIVRNAPNFNIVWYGGYLGDLIQTFTDIRVPQVMNMCHIIKIYLNENKNYGPKAIVTVEAGTGSTSAQFSRVFSLRGCFFVWKWILTW